MTTTYRHPNKKRKMIQNAEVVLDSLYHPLDMSRSDIDLELGIVRGAALVTAAIRGTSLPIEIRRSLERLKDREGVE